MTNSFVFQNFYASWKFENKFCFLFRCKKDDIPCCGGKYCWVGAGRGAGGGGGIYCGWGAFRKQKVVYFYSNSLLIKIQLFRLFNIIAVTNNNWFHSESFTNKWLKISLHMDTKHINWITTFRLQMRVLFLHVKENLLFKNLQLAVELELVLVANIVIAAVVVVASILVSKSYQMNYLTVALFLPHKLIINEHYYVHEKNTYRWSWCWWRSNWQAQFFMKTWARLWIVITVTISQI